MIARLFQARRDPHFADPGTRFEHHAGPSKTDHENAAGAFVRVAAQATEQAGCAQLSSSLFPRIAEKVNSIIALQLSDHRAAQPRPFMTGLGVKPRAAKPAELPSDGWC